MTFGTYWTSSILNQETVTRSQFYAEYIYNAFALDEHLQYRKNHVFERIMKGLSNKYLFCHL